MTAAPGGGDPHAARAALEDLHAQRLLHLRNLRAHRRLGDAARLGRLAEPAEVGDGDEVLQSAAANTGRCPTET